MKRLFVIAYLNGYSSILKYLVDLSSSHTDYNVKNILHFLNCSMNVPGAEIEGTSFVFRRYSKNSS